MNAKFTVLSLFIFLLLSTRVAAQQIEKDSASIRKTEEYYRRVPAWIDMMKDPNVNYYEACKAFDLFWEGKELPAESEGEAASFKEGEEEGLQFKNPETYKYIYPYKQFMNWRRAMKNKVDPSTGKIMSPEKQAEIWKQQTKGIETNIN